MEALFTFGGKQYKADLDTPIDISIPLRAGTDTVNCFYAPFMEISPVIAGSFIGDTQQGGPVNFMNVRLNPHGNGTHTECVGHIAKESFTIYQQLKKFLYIAKLISVYPLKAESGDRIITRDILEACVEPGEAQALIIRTMPNDTAKQQRHYSGTNPPYLTAEATQYIVSCGIEHLLIDLPSVDREEDGGALAAHKAFWQYPEAVREGCTITELIFVPDVIKDGLFLLNMQLASFELDVSPSKPILYNVVFV